MPSATWVQNEDVTSYDTLDILLSVLSLWRRFTVSKIVSLKSLNWFKVVPFETSTQRLRLLANFKIFIFPWYLGLSTVYDFILTPDASNFQESAALPCSDVLLFVVAVYSWENTLHCVT